MEQRSDTDYPRREDQRQDEEDITVYARWCSAEHLLERPRCCFPQMHYYAVPICPTEPLEVGRKVRILALSRTAYHTPNVVNPRYETYDPHVRGRVTEIVEAGEEAITFGLDNQCDINPIKKIRLTIRWVQNITAIVPRETLRMKNITLGHMAPLEVNATIAEPARRLECGAERCDGPRPEGT